MTVGMALVDYIPVFLFLANAIILQRDLYNKMSKGAFALLCSGTIMVFTAGFFKATWKLLYGAGICDFYKLSAAMMPMQSTGFFLAAVSLIAMMTAKQENGKERLMAVAAPAVYSGTMIFVAFMCSGITAMGVVLSIVAAKMKKKGAVVLFILTIVGLLMMGYLSGKDFEKPIFNWIAEFVNTLSQLAFLAGMLILHKAGLADFQLKKA